MSAFATLPLRPIALVSMLLGQSVALAGEATGPGPAPAAAPAPYSLPWQLRPAAAGTVVRSDTTLAGYQGTGSTVATMLLASFKVRPNLAPLVRLGFVNNAPAGGERGQSLVNPAVGATYLVPLSDTLRLGAFLGMTIPIGMGGGNTPDAATSSAAKSGVLARSAMDNAMFAVNDLTIFPGVDLAYVAGGWTVQAEATVLELIRVRGEAVQSDSAKTNFTCGLHVGRFINSMFSLGAEVRYQRWIIPPASITTRGPLDTFTFAAGPRLHFKLAQNLWFRPGLAYARGLDEPMAKQGYDIVQLDLPIAF